MVSRVTMREAAWCHMVNVVERPAGLVRVQVNTMERKQEQQENKTDTSDILLCVSFSRLVGMEMTCGFVC